MPAPHHTVEHEEFPVAIIGASTGGPPVVQQILEGLPAGTRTCILVAQHMPAAFTSRMAKRLAELVPLRVREAEDGDELAPGSVFIAPGGSTAEIARNAAGKLCIRLMPEATTSNASPSIDRLMRSAAKLLGRRVTGFLLTGMGNDGAIGMKFIRHLGHGTYVQDPVTCAVDSMVQEAIQGDAADEVVRVEQIPTIISRL